MIRASGARCDITRLAPLRRGRSLASCKEAEGAESRRPGNIADRSRAAPTGLRDLVLVRIACAVRGAAKAEIAADLAPIAEPGCRRRSGGPRSSARSSGSLAQASLTARRRAPQASEAGKAAGGQVPWGQRRASARVERPARRAARRRGARPAARVRQPPQGARHADGLRAAIVESAFDLKIKGVATPARLREALAATALKRAFGDKGSAGLAGKLGLSAKAGRLLAAQLSQEPRDFGTDTRLDCRAGGRARRRRSGDASAAARGAAAASSSALRRRLHPPSAPSRRALGKGMPASNPIARCRAALPARQLRSTGCRSPRAAGRRAGPTFTVSPPRCAAMPRARRKAGAATARPTSATCGAICARSAPTGASRRSSSSACWRRRIAPAQLALANADLKDKDNIKDVQDSAVSFRNAVFHFIRVDA